jgi:hypothetical protein
MQQVLGDQAGNIQALEKQRAITLLKLQESVAIAEQDLGAAFTIGLTRWTYSVETLAESLVELGETIAQEFSDTVGSVAGDLIRGEDVDAREVAGEYLANIAENMVTTLVSNLLQLILSNTILKTALDYNSAQLSANTVSNYASAGSYYGGAVGYDSGGTVKAHNFPKPSYIHPRDTVRAWLTPGEHVMTTSATKMLGHDFFDMINSMARTNAAFGSRVAASSGMFPIIGRAEGGGVGNTSALSSTSRRLPQEQQTVVLPVLVADEATGEQIYSGSKDAFNFQASKSRSFDDPNRSGF